MATRADGTVAALASALGPLEWQEVIAKAVQKATKATKGTESRLNISILLLVPNIACLHGAWNQMGVGQ
jgi:hypothetical protein